jgi:hypothetical protein
VPARRSVRDRKRLDLDRRFRQASQAGALALRRRADCMTALATIRLRRHRSVVRSGRAVAEDALAPGLRDASPFDLPVRADASPMRREQSLQRTPKGITRRAARASRPPPPAQRDLSPTQRTKRASKPCLGRDESPRAPERLSQLDARRWRWRSRAGRPGDSAGTSQGLESNASRGVGSPRIRFTHHRGG